MKKLNNLTHLFILLFINFSLFLVSCGTEEEPADETLTVSVNSPSVMVGTPITFTATSSMGTDVSSSSVFYVNDESITGNVFTPTVPNLENSVYAIYNGITSPTIHFSSTEEGVVQFTQKVLLEDYTGTWCGYCPRMVTIADYLTEYSENIIPVAIHCDGPDDPWIYDLGATMQNTYGANSLPQGRINRNINLNQYQGTTLCPFDSNLYTPQMDSYLQRQASLGLAISSTVSGNAAAINVKVGFASDNLSDLRLVLYLLEDSGLIYNQVNYFAGGSDICDPNHNYSQMPNPIPNFAQNHVLLKTYTDIFGDTIPQEQIFNGNIWTKNFNVNLPANVTNVQNLKLVAFVLNNGNSENQRTVLNVQSAMINTTQDFD